MKSWKDISIKKYLEIQSIIDSEMEESEMTIQIANVIYDCDVTELPLPEYQKKIKGLSFVNSKPETEKLANSYTINGTKYIVKSDLGSIQANQFIDFQNYAKKQDMIGCISCFFIPEGHKYNVDYDLEKVKEDIAELPITSANALSFFFKSQYAALLILTQRSSLLKMKEMGMSKEKIKEMQESLTTLGIANLASTLSF